MLSLVRKWFWAFINKAEEEPFRHPDRFCVICDERIWPWQQTTRLHSLGMNRAHTKCAAEYFRDLYVKQTHEG